MALDPKTLRGNWNYPTSIRFGPGRIAELPEACKALGMTRPLLVTDPGLAKLPMVANALAALKAAGLAAGLFADIKPNPVGRNVADGVAAFGKGGHDGVIAFGGGSGLDVAKSVAFMAGQSRPLWDFEDVDDWYLRANAGGIAPVVAVPTTAGTGSEVGRATAIINEETRMKKIIFHPKMMPGIVVADPELTLGLPPRLTAGTGMDALAHCLEAYCAPSYHPLAEGVAMEGMRLAKEYLPRAVKNGADLEARAQMMVASMCGATAFQKGLGAIHALSHPVGAHLDSHHGETNGVVMPYVVAFNAKAIEEKLTRLARLLDLPRPSPSAVVDWILALREAIGTPRTLAELGMSEAEIPTFAKEGAVDPAGGGNPIPLDENNLAGLFRDCIRGELKAA